MSIKLELYRVFNEVAKEKSISAAAKNLFISQSAVSQTIKQLEEQLEVRLFTRSTRGVSLTAEGNILYEYVRSAVSLIENGEDKMAQTKGLYMGELAIGASDTVTNSLLLPILDRFHREYPAIRLRVLNGTSPEVVGLLRNGKVDISFANMAADSLRDSAIQVRPYMEVEDVFVAAAGYPIDFDRVYTPAELAAMPLVLLERKASSRLNLDEYFLRNGVSMVPEIELGSHDLLVAITRIGLGVSCVTRQFAAEPLKNGALRPLKVSPPPPGRGIGLCMLRGVSPSAACAKFLEMAEAAALSQD